MIDLISSLFKEGDSIKIEYGANAQVVSGTILKIAPSSIAIKKSTGGLAGIKGDEIISFDTTENLEIPVIPVVSANRDEAPVPTQEEKTSQINIQSDNAETPCIAIPTVEQKTETSGEKEEPVNTKVDETNSSQSPIVANKEYKPGDIIPLATLEKIDSTINKKNRFPGKHKAKLLGTDFSVLASMAQANHDLDNLNRVPALGEVVSYFPDRAFGFIYDGVSKATIYFNASQIVDDSKSLLSKGAPLIYSISQSSQGPRAVSIHKPGSIGDILRVSEELYLQSEFKKAFDVVEHILKEYPDNFDAEMLRRKIAPNVPYYQQTKPKEYSSIYSKAKKYHEEKKYDKAIEYYLKAIETGHKVESAVKDLAALYASLFKSSSTEEEKEKFRNKAIDLMDNHISDMPSNISTEYFLENFYYSIEEYERCAEVISLLVEEREVIRDKTKLSILLVKRAASYLRNNEFDRALDSIDEALSINPNNISALKLKALIEDPQEGDIETIMSSADFDTLSIGLSPFIENTIAEYEEYFGVQPIIIEKGDFNTTTLKAIRNLIDKAGSGRPRERAKYLLTEAKLMTILEEDKIVALRSELAKYCNAMAINHIYDNNPMDIVRFYYNEAFSLEQKWDSTRLQVSYYLLSACLSYNDLINVIGKNCSIDVALKQVLVGDVDNKKWDVIITMFLNNPEITAQITSKLYANTDYLKKSILALKVWGVYINATGITKDEFANAWNAARDIRIREYRQAVALIKSAMDSTDLEECVHRLFDIRNHKKDWMAALDIRRLYTIEDNIAPALDNYIKSSGYRNKESNYNSANGQLQQLIEEIIVGPTSLSYDALLPLLKKVQTLLTSSFEEVIKQSEPRLSIELLSSETVVNDKDIVSLQIAVKNHKDSSPIREASVSIVPTEDLVLVEEDNSSSNAIEGGEERIFRLSIKVSETVIHNKAAALDAVCKYKSGNEEKYFQKQLSLKLYSQDEYRPIENPYAAVADGGPVPVSSNMFYGREEFISNVCESIINSPSKQVIIYGQKRCGKSSVMLHLKEKLQGTGKTFCIFFSLGDIVNNLTEASFYYKILSTIQQEIENLEFDGEENLPSVDFPTYTAFKQEDDDNPLNTFTKYMIRFKQACKKTPGWEEKNLVVMIDEFTYLYTEIKHEKISPSIMKQWKAVTQNDRAQFSVVLVGQDVVPSFKKEDYARNAFGVIQDIRLTYLLEGPARDLIEKPILTESGESRYIGNAVSRIIEYTSRNPYYIQIFCARLVEYMNRNKSIMVTEADVNDVAKSFIKGDQALEEDKFDNLIRAGETEDLQEYPEKEISSVLHAIAFGSKNISYCNRSDINVFEDKEHENSILKHLEEREVIERKNDNYKIQVKLFQEWLLNH